MSARSTILAIVAPGRRYRLIVAGLVVASLLSSAVAQAASPWQPFHSSPFDLPAGARCSFPLSGRILQDGERIRTISSFPDGTPQRQEVSGPLVVRYINVATGASVVRNLTGDALLDQGADGSSTITLVGGHLAVGLGASDPGGPTFLVLSGHAHSLSIDAEGRRTLRLGSGPVENICRTLGG